jgi:hypothetical protein
VNKLCKIDVFIIDISVFTGAYEAEVLESLETGTVIIVLLC